MDKYPNINKVGVELEGGWERDNDYRDEIKGDCSVNVNDGNDRDRDYDDDDYDEDEDSGTYINGEIVSHPISKWDELSNFMMDRYPDKVNSTCGLHVHISTNTIGQYQALATQRFYNFMKFSLRTWGKKANIRNSHRFWDRLSGSNQYCEDFFEPERQMFDEYKSGARYCIVNYCYSLHGTMEVRVLPMFDQPKVSIAAVNNILWTVNKYLTLPSSFKDELVVREEILEMDLEPATVAQLINVA